MRLPGTVDVFIRFPKTCLIVGIALFITLAGSWSRIAVRSETAVLLEGDQRNQASYEKVQDILQDSTVVVVVLRFPDGPDVFSSTAMETIRDVSEAFYQQPGLIDVKSFTHSVKPVRQGFAFSMVPLVSQEPTESELDALRRFSLENPLIRDVMVSSDARSTILLNTYHRSLDTPAQQLAFAGEIEQILTPFRSQGLEASVLGLPIIEHEVRSTLTHNVQRFFPAAIVLMLVVLGITLRSAIAVLAALLIHAMVLMALPAVIAVSGQSITVFTAIAFPLISAIHLMLMVHLLDSMRRWPGDPEDSIKRVRFALSEVLRPSVYAAGTTAIGLLSLNVSSIPHIRDFGNLGALGMATIIVMTFGPGTSLLCLLAARFPSPLATRASESQGSESGAAPAPTAPPWPTIPRHPAVIAIVVAGLAVALFGSARIRTDVRAVEFLDPSSPTRRAVEQLDATFGGINVLQVEIDTGQPNGVNAPGFLTYLQSLQDDAGQKADVTQVYSYAQLLAMMNQIWEQEAPDSFRVPTNPLKLGVFTVALKAQRLPFLAALVDPEFRKTYFIIRTRDMPAEPYLALIRNILDRAESARPSGVHVSASKGLHTILSADRAILESQLESAGFTLGVLLLVLTLLWRSLSLAFAAMITNVLPVGVALGMAGWFDWPLNCITVMVAAIALGIAVDDSVHWITYFQQQRQSGASVGNAIQATQRAKARPIIGSSTLLIAVVALFGFASFPPVRQFGALMAIALAAALPSVLLLLPTLIQKTQQQNAPNPPPSQP